MLPDEYVALIKQALTVTGHYASNTKEAYTDLTERYRNSNASGFNSKAEMAAYIEARFPATFSVVAHILGAEITADTPIQSTLDLGAGPGTATLAAINHFPILYATLVEQTPEFMSAAKVVLTPTYPSTSFTYSCESVHNANFPKVDLVLLSYLLTEMHERQALRLYESSLNATKIFNLVILPGTPAAFKLLLQLRDQAIALGYTIVAPCPHGMICPMTQQTDQWCHFRQRLSRSRAHQAIKKGSLGYEDEPYCYLLVTPGKSDHAADKNVITENRIINTPRHRPGHIYVDVCTKSGARETQCVTKKDKSVFKTAKDLKWGDRI
ncbi:MAG: small ribosomal subunit Rsm22 family protein [Pseudomonadota bacterium]